MSIKVKLLDEEHEKDLEDEINQFLAEEDIHKLLDIKYQISHFSDGPGQIYSYSALILYETKT